MTESETPFDDIRKLSTQKGKDNKTRYALYVVAALWLFTVVLLMYVAWNAYFKEKEKVLSLAEQINISCDRGVLSPKAESKDFSSALSPEEKKVLCKNAKEIVEENDPELQNEEVQESEIQDPEIQDSEFQNPEALDPEIQDSETQNEEVQDVELQDIEQQDEEVQDSEQQDEEVQDPELQEEEVQDPEINDPDPADDDVSGGNCSFTGFGTIVFTLQTDSGAVTFECTGSGSLPDPQTEGDNNDGS